MVFRVANRGPNLKRKLRNLANHHYDLAIVGGGIYGACIAWEASLRGFRVCLIEKSDFGSATSANSLKIIHGGLRYLQHGNLLAMRKLIHERRTWMGIAPHLVHPLPVLIPTYSHYERNMLSAAILVNNLLNLDRNSVENPQKSVPAGKMISKSQCLEFLPGLSEDGLTGGVVFYDAQIYNTERLLLSFLRSAEKMGADMANYIEARKLLKVGTRILGVEVKDVLTGDTFSIQAKAVANTCGPWLNDGLFSSTETATTGRPVYAKAINLLTRPLFERYAVGLLGHNGYSHRNAVLPKRKARLFVTPWRDRSLIGTHYAPYHGAPDDFKVTEQDVQAFLDEINASHSAAALTMHDVTLVHGGLLPAANTSSTTGEVELSTKTEILDQSNGGIGGVLSVKGVKYTTARLVAERVVDRVFEGNLKKPPRSLSSLTPIYGGEIDGLERFVRSETHKQPFGLTEKTIRRLICNYGSSYPEVLQYFNFGAECQGSTEELAVLRAEIIHGVRDEMAQKLSDVVFRRTELGTAGYPGSEALAICANVMSAELAWTPERTRRELSETTRAFGIGGCDTTTR